MRMASDIATCMRYTGFDPFTGEEVHISRRLRDRKMQRTLLRFFKPENYFMVRETLLKAGRRRPHRQRVRRPDPEPAAASGARSEEATSE